MEHRALHLGDADSDSSQPPDFLSNLTTVERKSLMAEGLRKEANSGQLLFRQGTRHSGIYVLLSGHVRTFYVAPTGREITLAYWRNGHFVGGPEVFGRGGHLWSGAAIEDTRYLYLSGAQLGRLCREMPNLSIALIEGLVYKGHCFSDVIRMLGTRNASQRLAQVILALRDSPRNECGETPLVRGITHEELASMVGSTRQWVSTSLKRLEQRDLIRFDGRRIVIVCEEALREETEG